MAPVVLVFGVAGFVGSHLVREFSAAGYEVVGADRAVQLPSSSPSLAAYMQADVRDDERVAAVVHEAAPDIIVNLAALTNVQESWNRPQDTMQVNCLGAVNILEAAKEMAEPAKVLLIGSSEEYRPSASPLAEDDPLEASSPYGISKTAQERFAGAYAERYGLRIYRTRSFSHIGPGQSTDYAVASWCSQIAALEAAGRGGTIRVGNLDAVREMMDVRDSVHAYRIIVESDAAGDVFNVGSGEGWRLGDVLAKVMCFASHSVEVETDERLLRSHDNPVIVSSNVKLRERFGWAPRFSLDRSLADVYAEHLAQH